jgi:predicted methyltransferase
MNSRQLMVMLSASALYLLCSGTVASAESSLKVALDAQPDDIRARYSARHPQETLDFFGLKAGMTVVEALPGRGWYSKILLPALGPVGRLIGADYALDMYPKFNFYDDAYLEAKKTWRATWTAEAAGWSDRAGAAVDAFIFGSMPLSMDGQVDAVLFIRALHNLARFEADGGYLTSALGEAHRALKPGGIVGVVQHLAPATANDDWANGSNGYLKKDFVKKRLSAAGFEYVGEIDVNINPADQPTEEDFVWRLPPSFATSRDDPAKQEAYRAIGESTRMTLLFRKP